MKKVLVITYYWPPAGGPGVQRWLKFVKYLPHFNMQPIVYVPENPQYPIQDTAFEHEVSETIQILKQPIFEPYRWAAAFAGKKTQQISRGIIASKKQSFTERVLLWIRGNLFIPDARKFWIKPSVKFLSAYMTKEKIDTIITTGPPHSIHLIGLRLKKRTELKWLADFRDPWTTIGYHSQLKLSRYAANRHKIMEKAVLHHADRIVVTSATTKKEFQQLTDVPISVITNGYDDRPVKKVVLTEKFTLSHIGSLLSGRNPEALWKALAELIEEDEAFKTDFVLQLAGTISEDVLAAIHKHGLKSYTTVLGYLPHDKALALQYSSQILLLIEIDSTATRCIIPGKLFEYMMAKRPILALGPKDWDAFAIIKETKTGSGFTYLQKEAIKQKIKVYFEAFKKGNLTVQPVALEQYSRKQLTKKLAEQLKHL